MTVAPASAMAHHDRERACPPELEGPAETLHVWLAAMGIALQPISTASGNIGLGMAIAGLALRMAGVTLHRSIDGEGRARFRIRRFPQLLKSRRLLDAWLELLRQGWLRLLLAWLAWSWLALAWSPDRGFGIEQFRCTRVLAWIPLLWPIRHHWRTLVGGVLVGVFVMNVMQATQIAVGSPVSRFAAGAGLTTPTQTGLWAAVALSFWLIITVSASVPMALTSLPFAAFTGVGLVWSATRASALGLLAELVFANIVLALTSRGWLARAALRCLVGAVILGAATVFAGSYLQSKLTQAISETEQTLMGGKQTLTGGNGGMTSEIRLAMWKASLEGWRDSPIIGIGLGGIPSIMRKTTITTPAVDLRTVEMIHSTYITALVDTGLIGLGLLLGFAALLFRDVLRGLRGQPLLVASFGALVVWFVAAAFDGYQQSGGFLSVGAILIPLALADLRAGAQAAGTSSPTA